jgi:hypothetical protein
MSALADESWSSGASTDADSSGSAQRAEFQQLLQLFARLPTNKPSG